MGRRPQTERLTRTQRRIEELRKGDAAVPVRDASGRLRAGALVWVEQERHAFPFGCVAAAPSAFAEGQRERYQARLTELFNPATPTPEPPGVCRLELVEPIHAARLRQELDAPSAAGRTLHVHVCGAAVGMAEACAASDRDIGKRLAELYMLCFAHPAVAAIVWNGFADGDANVRGGGLLRQDLAPKYAYQALRKLIDFDWHTRAMGVTDDDGVFHFRGFFGDYRVGADLGEAATRIESFALRQA